MIRVAHFFAKTNNLGDLGSSLGIKKILKQNIDNLSFTDFHLKEKFRYNGIFQKKFDNEFDLLVLGGGGLIYRLDYQPSNWYFNIPLSKYKKINSLKIFWGIGLNSEYNNNKRWFIDSKTSDSIRKYFELADFIGVRDKLTYNYVESLGIKKHYLTPCPSIFLSDKTNSDRNNKIAINLTNRSVEIDKLKMTINKVINFLKGMDKTINFIIHDVDEDGFLNELAKDFKINLLIPKSPDDLMRIYESHELLIGMRGHSLLYSFGANVPSIALSYNKKCDAHMEMIGQEDSLIKHKHIYNSDRIISKIEDIYKNYDLIKSKFKLAKEKAINQNLKFVNDIMNHPAFEHIKPSE